VSLWYHFLKLRGTGQVLPYSALGGVAGRGR